MKSGPYMSDIKSNLIYLSGDVLAITTLHRRHKLSDILQYMCRKHIKLSLNSLLIDLVH